MKSAFWTLLLLLNACLASAQTTSTDTTIHDMAESAPFPMLASCAPARHPGWNTDSIRKCAELQFLSLLSSNIRYPAAAQEQNLQGTVVTTFVVEKDGKMSNFSTLKDIGGGCGAEAIRVLKALEEAGMRWQPATEKGQPVRMRQTVPLRFRLQESLPYYISSEGDSIYTNLDAEPVFKQGPEALIRFALDGLRYPAAYADSCKNGVIETTLVIRQDGSAILDNLLDFSSLGFDFQYEAIRLAHQSSGLWAPAQYQGRPVTTTLPFRMVFKSGAAGCADANARFERGTLLADEGATLLAQEKPDEAIAKWNEALALQPHNAEWLYYRGSALLNINKRDEACLDYNRIRSLLGITWFEPVRRLFCGW
jgi:TonB family protein